MTNAVPMDELLSRRCKRDHEQQSSTRGRIAAAAFYPIPFVRTRIKGIRLQKDISKSVITSVMIDPADQINSATGSNDVAPVENCRTSVIACGISQMSRPLTDTRTPNLYAAAGFSRTKVTPHHPMCGKDLWHVESTMAASRRTFLCEHSPA